MIAKTQVIEGATFDRYNLNLAISGRYLPDGTADAEIALRLTPVRVESNTIATANDGAIGIALSTLSGGDESTRRAVTEIQAALQTYITARGL